MNADDDEDPERLYCGMLWWGCGLLALAVGAAGFAIGWALWILAGMAG